MKIRTLIKGLLIAAISLILLFAAAWFFASYQLSRLDTFRACAMKLFNTLFCDCSALLVATSLNFNLKFLTLLFLSRLTSASTAAGVVAPLPATPGSWRYRRIWMRS